MKKYQSKINSERWVLLDNESSTVIQTLSKEEAVEWIKDFSTRNNGGKLSVHPMNFKHLSIDEKREELLNEIEQYKNDFDSSNNVGIMMRDVFVLDRQRYEFIIELLKNELKKKG